MGELRRSTIVQGIAETESGLAFGSGVFEAGIRYSHGFKIFTPVARKSSTLRVTTTSS
jgi:hypothetical protein